MSRRILPVLLALLICGCAQQAKPKWGVNDRKRPRPATVPARPQIELARASQPRANAIILFDGKDLSAWKPSTQPISWKVEDGHVETVKKAGDLVSQQPFGSCRLHLEFQTPAPPTGKDQAQGNSGVFLMGKYEMQVLDNTNNPTYPDGMAGAVYGENPPLADACRPSGEWNYYDITFHRPHFNRNGKLVEPAIVTAWLNGVKVQDDFKLTGPTKHKELDVYKPHADKLPLVLQNHGQIVRYRNVWIVPLED